MNTKDPFAPPPEQKAPKQGLRSRFAHGPRRLRVVPLNVMIPNLITLLALCAGLTALRFGLNGQWAAAVLAGTGAGLLDTLDGRIARLLKGSTKLGAELDSLTDLVCFGVMPGVVVYLWSLSSAPKFGWLAALLYVCCCALRLARFNSMLEDPDKPAWSAHFFTGFPAPFAAGMAMWPVVLSFITPWEWVRDPLFAGGVLLTASAMMIARVPTFSLKRIRFTGAQVPAVMLGAVAAIAFAISAPWWAFSALMAAYIISTPFAVLMHRRYQNQMKSNSGAGG